MGHLDGPVIGTREMRGTVHIRLQRHYGSKEVIHIISSQSIIEKLTSKSFHEPSVKLARIDVISTFWRTVRIISHNSFAANVVSWNDRLFLFHTRK